MPPSTTNKCLATPRELEMLRGVWAGLSNKEIAAQMGCSLKTVELHRTHLRQKLAVHNTAGLLREALKRKWISAAP